jgi:hypothetical protein
MLAAARPVVALCGRRRALTAEMRERMLIYLMAFLLLVVSAEVLWAQHGGCARPACGQSHNVLEAGRRLDTGSQPFERFPRARYRNYTEGNHMSDLKWLDGYSGQTLGQLLALEGECRIVRWSWRSSKP